MKTLVSLSETTPEAPYLLSKIYKKGIAGQCTQVFPSPWLIFVEFSESLGVDEASRGPS